MGHVHHSPLLWVRHCDWTPPVQSVESPVARKLRQFISPGRPLRVQDGLSCVLAALEHLHAEGEELRCWGGAGSSARARALYALSRRIVGQSPSVLPVVQTSSQFVRSICMPHSYLLKSLSSYVFHLFENENTCFSLIPAVVAVKPYVCSVGCFLIHKNA